MAAQAFIAPVMESPAHLRASAALKVSPAVVAGVVRMPAATITTHALASGFSVVTAACLMVGAAAAAVRGRRSDKVAVAAQRKKSVVTKVGGKARFVTDTDSPQGATSKVIKYVDGKARFVTDDAPKTKPVPKRKAKGPSGAAPGSDAGLRALLLG
mmetsp:Transcript_11119/g.27819  ORF Transcript_11119/g.27819 Transcript_11119/m.27819 type:complete len:156 (+) Transcript_11119:87-554(+)